jgi:radical SAM superfamily enzyme YgiQ (UPF0313 family)
MLKIVLLEPEFDEPFRRLLNEGRTYAVPPLWALSLGTFLKKRKPNSIDLTILDCRIFPVKKIADWSRRHKPDVAGISPKFSTYQSAIEAARIFKKNGARVVLGGMHAYALSREIFANRGPDSGDYCIDAIIKEDGERAFYEYVIGKSLEKIPNLIWLDKKTGLRENRLELLDLDSLPVADRDLVNANEYLRRTNTFTTMSQKGCAWREKSGGCIFCAQGLSGLRFRNPEKLWKEIDFLKKKYNIGTIWDSCENFLNNLDWLQEFWQISGKFKNKPRLKIFMRLEQVNDKVARMLQGINVKQAILGVEAGSQQSLTTFRKGTTPRIIKEKVRILHKHNIKTFHCYIFGAPKENETTMKETLKFARELAKTPGHSGSRFNSLIPFPGSPAWRMLSEKTGERYLGKDLLNWRQVVNDWLINFCDIDIKRYSQIRSEAKKFSEKANKKNII